jgi:hypothetical protein
LTIAVIDIAGILGGKVNFLAKLNGDSVESGAVILCSERA